MNAVKFGSAKIPARANALLDLECVVTNSVLELYVLQESCQRRFPS